MNVAQRLPIRTVPLYNQDESVALGGCHTGEAILVRNGATQPPRNVSGAVVYEGA